MPLLIIGFLLVFKHVPLAAGLPLARSAGIVAFGYAAFLALRLLQDEEAAQIGGWSELRPSMVEYFACYGAAALALALVLMSAVVMIGGSKHVAATQMIATFLASILLGAGALGIGLGGLFTRVRWTNAKLEHRTALGRHTTINWSDVRAVRPNWRGVTIATNAAERITFSQFHSGAAQLAIYASNCAQRNAETTTKAIATP